MIKHVKRWAHVGFNLTVFVVGVTALFIGHGYVVEALPASGPQAPPPEVPEELTWAEKAMEPQALFPLLVAALSAIYLISNGMYLKYSKVSRELRRQQQEDDQKETLLAAEQMLKETVDPAVDKLDAQLEEIMTEIACVRNSVLQLQSCYYGLNTRITSLEGYLDQYLERVDAELSRILTQLTDEHHVVKLHKKGGIEKGFEFEVDGVTFCPTRIKDLNF